jgi:DNA-binding NarL/FixJ family response regulator
MRGGASAVLLKGCSTQDLRLAVEAAAEGRVAQGQIPGDAQSTEVDLSAKVRVGGVRLRVRHAAVLVLLLDGLDRRTIASRLGMTLRGVDYCVRTLKDATGINALVGLLHWAMEHQAGLRHAARGELSGRPAAGLNLGTE